MIDGGREANIIFKRTLDNRGEPRQKATKKIFPAKHRNIIWTRTVSFIRCQVPFPQNLPQEEFPPGLPRMASPMTMMMHARASFSPGSKQILVPRRSEPPLLSPADSPKGLSLSKRTRVPYNYTYIATKRKLPSREPPVSLSVPRTRHFALS